MREKEWGGLERERDTPPSGYTLTGRLPTGLYTELDSRFFSSFSEELRRSPRFSFPFPL